jgi:beta-1,4-mannooligosaccharide/beta-1,4-mannosyl-N-acetylglucosamine phosphorylase
LYDEPTGRIAIYYGGADTVTALAFTHLPDVLDFLKNNNDL